MILLFLISIGVGILVSLLVLLPPLRGIAREFPTIRLFVAFTLGLTSFGILYSSQTYLLAHSAYHSGNLQYECPSCDRMIYFPPEFTQEELEYKQAIMIEYWARNLLPPSFQSDCNTKNATVCRLTEDISLRKGSQKYTNPTRYEETLWNTFYLNFATSLAATFSTIVFVAIFTCTPDFKNRKQMKIPSTA
jgi:hypothetical protein